MKISPLIDNSSSILHNAIEDIMNSKLFTIALAVVGTSTIASAQAGTLYFNQDNTGNLFSVSTTTGAATLAGTTGTTSSTVGLAGGPGTTLYGSTWTQLSQIDPGVGHTIIGGNLQAEGLAWDNVNNVLYGALNGSFFSADPATGNRTANLATTNTDIEGLEYYNGFIYALDTVGDFYRYDISSNTWSSALTNVGSLGFGVGLAFDAATQTFYYASDRDNNLYAMDFGTLTTTMIGDMGVSAGGGLAIKPVPEPFSLLAIGGAALLAARRRKKA